MSPKVLKRRYWAQVSSDPGAWKRPLEFVANAPADPGTVVGVDGLIVTVGGWLQSLFWTLMPFIKVCARVRLRAKKAYGEVHHG